MRRLAIAIDLGGTQIRAALVDELGHVLRRTALTTAAKAGPEVVIEQISECAAQVRAGVARKDLAGVGICAPGPLDAEEGIVLSIPTLVGFVDLPLARILETSIGLPVRLQNDAMAAALGEWRFGAARGHRNVVYVTVSTGIGGGVIADGHLLHGRRGMAGHVGHMTIVRDGERCACGNRGCFEAYASGTAFAKRARLRAGSEASTLSAADPIDGRAVFEAASRGDALAASLVAEEADLLGIGIASLLHLYSPDIVVIGGGIANGFDLLAPGISARIASAAMPPFRDTPVVRASLGDNSGLIGAAAWTFD
jgi:glucokinase